MSAFRRIMEGLRSRHIPAILFGGFALPLYGVERATLDIDFMLCDEDLAAFAAVVGECAYREVLRTPQYARFRASSETLDLDTVFVDRPTIVRVWAEGTDEMVLGATVRCVSLDILLGTKLHAIRYNEENRRRRDFDDIVELLAANGIDPWGERFARICQRYGTDEIRERVCRTMKK